MTSEGGAPHASTVTTDNFNGPKASLIGSNLLLPAPQAPSHTFKVVLIGDAGVGKTSLRARFTHGLFSPVYRATIGCDFLSRTCWLGEQGATKVVLSVWDTAGQERFRSLGASFYRGADACVLLYSDRQSLSNLTSWFDEFVARCPVDDHEVGEFTWAAVGCKKDAWKDDRPHEQEVRTLLHRIVPQRQQDSSVSTGYEVDDNGHNHHSSTSKHEPISSDPLHCDRGADAQASAHVTPSKLRVKGGRSRHCCGHDQTLASKRSNISMTTSVYHTPSSTMRGSRAIARQRSRDSLLSEDTVMPGTPSTVASSMSASSWLSHDITNEEFFADSAELAKERARGVDVFMATSPPHNPKSILARDVTTYKGGPSVFHKQDEAQQRSSSGKPPAMDKVKSIKATVTNETNGDDNVAEASKDTVTTAGGDSAYNSCMSAQSRLLSDHDFSSDGIKHFTTSAKTGEGVDEL
ncbi:hypothetical protein OIO90_001958 [Microbotryomycetes sp. JL221]|nr:hypothetical protein OIO90_001958 [Microbotryomycetes sp. JL221]